MKERRRKKESRERVRERNLFWAVLGRVGKHQMLQRRAGLSQLRREGRAEPHCALDLAELECQL